MNPLDRDWTGDPELGELMRTNFVPENRAFYWLAHYALITGEDPPTDDAFLADVAARADTDRLTVLLTHRQISSKGKGFGGFAVVGRSRRADQN